MYDKYVDASSEKQRIFDVAMQLMDKVGYENLTIRKICKEAGISTGKFYLYFSNKQALLSHFYENLEAKIAGEASERFHNLPLKEAIVEFYRWYLDYTASLGVEFVINYFNPRNGSMDIMTQNNFIMSQTDLFLEKAIQEGFRLPEGKTIHQLSQQMCMVIKGVIFTWAAAHGSFSLPDTAAEVLGKSLDGILFD